MAERYDYDRERRWRDQSGDWWNEGGQNWDEQDQEWNRTRQWRRGSERDWQQSSRDFNRGPNRDQNRDRWQESNDRDTFGDRPRWQESNDRDTFGDRPRWQESNDRDTFGDQYGRNYGTDWNTSGEDYDWDYGQNRRSGRDFGQDFRNDRESGRDRDRQHNQADRVDRMRGDDRWGAAFGGDRGNYGETRGRQQGVNRNEQIYNRDWYDWDYENGGSEADDFSRNQQYGDTRDVARWRNYRDSDRQGYQRGQGQSGERDRWQNQDRYRSGGWGSEYRTAGMRSDYGQNADYEQRDYMDENLNYRRGDVGYDSEGAFYQDLDEPINNRYGWDVPGQYRGVGPQNYRRSDERINEDVSERLANHGRVDASDIEIDVNGGEVTLKGTVPSREMKRLAEDVAIEITGVQDVHNEIKVKPRQNRGPNLTNRGYDLGEDWDQPADRNRDRGDWNASRDRYASDMQRDQNRQDWATPRSENAQAADFSPAGGESNVGAGLTGAGATSIEGMEAASGVENRRNQLREGMEVIDTQGKMIGRVKELRESDFLVDREMARDVYVPYSAIESVGAQAMLKVLSTDVDNQGWEKPNIL